jgi:hypothetical protein
MHMVLALTLEHDQYLNNEPGVKTSRERLIAFHFSRGVMQLNNKISSGLAPSERDAAWASGGLLGVLTFSSMKAKTPKDTWPQSESTATDLDWLNITQGKKALLKIADPFRPESIFSSMMAEFLQYAAPSHSESILALENLPPELIHVCGLHKDSTLLENPYLSTASFLGLLWHTKCTLQNIRLFLAFFGSMHPEYKTLLQNKDPVALLLLGIWYKQISSCQQWWIQRRAVLGHQAIAQFLASYCGEGYDISCALQNLNFSF